MRFTIVTPTLDAERWLEECLASVNQSSEPGVQIRHLIVDCGSGDATVEIAQRAGVDVMCVERRGLFYQINQGYRHADADVIGYLGGDDTLLPGAVAEIARWFRRPVREEWLVGAIRWTNAKGRPIGDVKPPRALAPQALASLGWCCISHQSTVLTPRLFDSVGGFDEKFRRVGDHDFFIRVLQRYPKFDRTSRCLATFRRHGDNVSMAADERLMREEQWIVRENSPANPLHRQLLHLMLKLRMNAGNPGWFFHKKAPGLARFFTPPGKPTGATQS